MHTSPRSSLPRKLIQKLRIAYRKDFQRDLSLEDAKELGDALVDLVGDLLVRRFNYDKASPNTENTTSLNKAENEKSLPSGE